MLTYGQSKMMLANKDRREELMSALSRLNDAPEMFCDIIADSEELPLLRLLFLQRLEVLDRCEEAIWLDDKTEFRRLFDG